MARVFGGSRATYTYYVRGEDAVLVRELLLARDATMPVVAVTTDSPCTGLGIMSTCDGGLEDHEAEKRIASALVARMNDECAFGCTWEVWDVRGE